MEKLTSGAIQKIYAEDGVTGFQPSLQVNNIHAHSIFHNVDSYYINILVF